MISLLSLSVPSVPRLGLLFALCCGLVLVGRPLSAQVPPAAEWRTFDTEHFRISYVAGLEPVARRAADRAEEAYAALSGELTEPPEGVIDLVIADNVDFANGYATPLPTNRIVLYAHPPVSESELAFYEDWLQLLVLHELVHIFHLDTAEGIWERLRSVFGRNVALFPQFYTPGWAIEGLATYYESRLTAAGRVRGTLHDMVLRTAVLEDEFFPIDRATGDPVRWPAASTRYVYGSRFVDFLARRYGEERLGEFLEAYGGQLVPYRLNRAARRSLGTTFGRAWGEWEDSLRARYLPLADSLRAAGLTEPEILTEEGRGAFYPRYAPNGAAIAYAAASGLDEPSTRLVLADGTTRAVADRTTLGPSSWYPDSYRLLFAELDYVDPYHIYSDLHRVRVGGDDDRLTRAARLWEPSLHPDARRAVVVANAGGSNVLALHDLETGETRVLTEPTLDVHWSLPRWSPDGSRIAVARWSRGGLYDVVLLDTAGAVVRELTRDRAIDAAPAWSPDGRYVVFSSDRTGIPNLYAYDLRREELFQVSNVLTGAVQPDVSPDGRWIAFSYYRADGYHIARMPFDPSRWRPAPPPRPEVAEALPPHAYAEAAGGPARSYSPWPTVLPASWAVVAEGGTDLGYGAGVAVSGADAIERHLWSAELVLHSNGWRPGGGALYRYRGWGNPILDLSASQDWSVARAPTDSVPSALFLRDREIAASLLWLRRRWRSSAWVQPGAELRELDFRFDEPERVPNAGLRSFPLDAGATLDFGYSSARGYGLSIGPQEGFTAASTLEGHRYLEPIEGEQDARGYLRLTGRGRGYEALPLPGFARHVLAFRLDAGAETGSRSPGFGVGGATGGRAPLPLDLAVLGGRLAFPVRGYPEGAQRGNRALSATAEYRFPIALVERGLGIVPLFLSRLWGDVYADAGAAWCPGGGCQGFVQAPQLDFDPLYSVGAEVTADLRLGFAVDLPVRLGVAFPLREPYAGGPEFYVRLGRAF